MYRKRMIATTIYYNIVIRIKEQFFSMNSWPILHYFSEISRLNVLFTQRYLKALGSFKSQWFGLFGLFLVINGNI